MGSRKRRGALRAFTHHFVTSVTSVRGPSSRVYTESSRIARPLTAVAAPMPCPSAARSVCVTVCVPLAGVLAVATLSPRP